MHNMSDEVESKFSMVVRRPQEGKTTICIKSITKDTSKNVALVITMNTLDSNKQFIGRLQQKIAPENIVVFNSDKKSAGDCHHASSAEQVSKLIDNSLRSGHSPIKVVICCAHAKRIRESIPELLEAGTNSIRFMRSNIKFIIHIDEAHKYIPGNLQYIRQFNLSPIVSEIVGYSATPDGIWSSNTRDPLFHKILIRDVETDLSIMSSTSYFGVKDCQHILFDEINPAELAERIPSEIPPHILRLAGMDITSRSWFYETWPFDFGNERLALGYLDFILPTLQIEPDRFSYHFAPSFTRKVTHYQCMDIILKNYPTANVIVKNADGDKLFRTRSGKSCIIKTSDMVRSMTRGEAELCALLEPSYMIQKLIQDTPNCPTFITGFTCVGMSVTFINTTLGNFDSVIMSHEHYSRDKLYQLCRFLFNCENWTSEQRATIKQTNFYSLSSSCVTTCLEYEAHIARITTDFSGKTCSLRETMGLAQEEPSAREIRNREICAIERKMDKESGKLWKKFKVYDGNDDAEWEKAQHFYESILGKRICGKSMPKKNDDGFYCCSDSSGLGVKSSTTFNNLKDEKWSNRFQLKNGCLSYAHVFVGYENVDESSEYTIFIKFVELVDNETTREFLAKHYGTA